MYPPKFVLSAFVFAAIVLAGNSAWGLGEGLGETREQLHLKYEVSVADHGTGRVTVTITIADEGRLKPLDSVDLSIPSKDGSGYYDLALSLATTKVHGKLVARVHMKKELAERAQLDLKTHHLDGKEQALTWYYHSIPISDFLKNGESKKKH